MAQTEAASRQTTQNSGEIDVDVIFHILSNRRRRYVLHYLLQRSEAVELSDLASQVTAWEYQIPVEEVTHKQRKRVYTALRQTHLPSMHDEGVIVYDTRTGRVEPTEATAEFDIYMDIVPRNEIPWSQYYLGLGVLFCAMTAAAAVVPFPPFTSFPDIAWAGLFAVILLASAGAHVYHSLTWQLGSDGEPPELQAE